MAQEIYGDGSMLDAERRGRQRTSSEKFSSPVIRCSMLSANIWILQAHNRNLVCRTLSTVVSGNSNSLTAVRMDLTGERLNDCLSLSMFS